MESEFSCLENCPKLGSCCKNIALNVNGKLITSNIGLDDVKTFISAMKWPLDASYVDETGLWRFDCFNLGSDGMCMDYENRPQFCRACEPRNSDLCCVSKNIMTEYLFKPFFEKLKPLWLIFCSK